MAFGQKYNRRFWGWLLSLALLVMALPSHAIWQCLDGTPCPLTCPTLRGSNPSAATQHQATPVASNCIRCHSAPVAIFQVSPETEVICKTTTCVLRAQTQPAATLAGESVIILPLLALPPPCFIFAVVASPSAYIPCTGLLFFLPQRFLRPHPGRAPPSCLA